MKTISVKVVSATKLTKKQLTAIEKAVSDKYPGATVNLETKIDASVIGGVKLLINSVEYDATVSGKLNKLHTHLTESL